MEQVTISSKFQIVLPVKMRKKYKLEPGQKLTFIDVDGSPRILIPRDAKDSFGSLKDFPGLTSEIDRSGDRY